MYDIISFLRGISNYMWGLSEANGRLICPKHAVEHTGKNVYTVITDLTLYSSTGESEFLERAIQRARRAAANLVTDPDSGAWIFWPGRLAERNMANSVIDGGACADALASLCMQVGDQIASADRDLLIDAVRRHCDTYLVDAARTKEVTNQRLWGATGLASAYALLQVPAWRDAVVASVERSLAEQNVDGSFPYHPNYREYGAHVGLSDITTYYHSRHAGFIFHALGQTGVPVTPYAEALERALDFLLALMRPDGIKELRLETKRWYWESQYEVVSNPYDIYALVQGYRHFGHQRYLDYAVAAYHSLRAHQLSDGGVDSHRGPGHNLQCRVFWNGQVAWLARVAEDLSGEPSRPPSELRSFPVAGLVAYDAPGLSVKLRGAKKPVNVCWGTPVGGGSLVYLGQPINGWGNQVPGNPLTGLPAANFAVRAPGGTGLKGRYRGFWQTNWPYKDIRRRLWLASVEFRGGLWIHGLTYPFRHLLLPLLRTLRGTWYSHLHTSPTLKIQGDTVRFNGGLARCDGESLPGATLMRTYKLSPQGLTVQEHLQIAGPVRNARYRLPPGAEAVAVAGMQPRSCGTLLVWGPSDRLDLNISYFIPASVGGGGG